ncbi:20093_t:CDS:2 [Rhizophagus irregularis]|nr:20093_t:CDS:2 [Rhizophagus irregularis]
MSSLVLKEERISDRDKGFKAKKRKEFKECSRWQELKRDRRIIYDHEASERNVIKFQGTQFNEESDEDTTLPHGLLRNLGQVLPYDEFILKTVTEFRTNPSSLGI